MRSEQQAPLVRVNLYIEAGVESWWEDFLCLFCKIILMLIMAESAWMRRSFQVTLLSFISETNQLSLKLDPWLYVQWVILRFNSSANKIKLK